MRRDREAVRQTQERRRREDDAARLRSVIPHLKTLTLRVEEKEKERPEDSVLYIKHVVVDRAPALFELPCCRRGCCDGGYDVTRQVIRALKRGETQFGGRDKCDGHTKDEQCARKLFFRAEADYEKAS